MRAALAQIEFIKDIIEKESEGESDILVFYPLSDEVDIRPVFDEIRESGHRLYFPVTSDDDMDFFLAGESFDFRPAALGVMEPVDKSRPYRYGRGQTICLTPGTVFSIKKQRKGRGKGYYDRFFSDKPDIFKIGVTTEAQIVDEMETNPWDVDMDAVVTEERIIR